ncbi:hypothetical protein LTR08_000929 [Meristemomyces frigidus]|nr:hypothetical protein LTR08_000929 [Meristemomyces frigidus]
MPDTWRDIAARKQKERTERIPKAWLLQSAASSPKAKGTTILNVPRECGILTTEEIRITEEYDATALSRELASGKLRSVDVVTAFCKRAAIAQQLTNCLTEIFFDAAIVRARELDEHFTKTGKPKGALHGLPISIKDTFKVKSYDASIGIASLCFKPATTNSALVEVLIEQGAVLFCKTNIPQTMMALDSHNNVFGRVLNPANGDLTPGGSSGGEGALVAIRGSALGIGTDVGGSIRIPAMCNGLVGFKPSHGRVPYAGQEGGLPAGSSKLAIESTAGPIARTVRDCELLLRAVGSGKPWLFDPDVVPQAWDEQAALHMLGPSNKAQKPLRVGIVRTDGHSSPLPPIQRLLEDVSQTLRSSVSPRGAIEVVDLDIASLAMQCVKTFNGIMSIDGASTWLDLLDKTGEPLSPWLQTRLRRRPQKSLDEVRKLQAQMTDLRTRFLDIWSERGGYWLTADSKAKKGDKALDVIICPVAPHPIPPVDRWNSTNYTSAFNLLDYPAGVLPVRTFGEADLEGELPQSSPLNGWDKINRELWTNVNRKAYLGSPLSVQIVAPKLMDRKLIDAMAVLETTFASVKPSTSKASKL